MEHIFQKRETMSWFSDVLAKIQERASEVERTQIDGEYIAQGMREAIQEITTAYVNEAEKARPFSTFYANPDDMR